MERLDVLAGLREARARSEPAALATVVNVIGSAYRREGTVMLVRQDGSYTCMVSGGCLEPEIVFLAHEVLKDGAPRLQRYNLDEERMFGLGIGCAGEIDLYIEPATDDPVLARWHAAWEGFELAALVTRLDGSGARTFVTPTETLGSVGAAQDAAGRLARDRLARAHPKSGLVHLDGVPHFLDVHVPPPELMLFGAAHDTISVAQLARRSGFRVHVVDMRAAMLTPDRFPGAVLHALRPERFDQLVIGPRTFVVVMNHHFLVDLASLRRALRSEAPYVGLLGPRSRLEKIAANARDEGRPFTPEELRRVRNPVGLAVGADNTDEVALSIVGELLAVSRGFGGGFLNGHAGQIHTPTATVAGTD